MNKKRKNTDKLITPIGLIKILNIAKTKLNLYLFLNKQYKNMEEKNKYGISLMIKNESS